MKQADLLRPISEEDREVIDRVLGQLNKEIDAIFNPEAAEHVKAMIVLTAPRGHWREHALALGEML